MGQSLGCVITVCCSVLQCVAVSGGSVYALLYRMRQSLGCILAVYFSLLQFVFFTEWAPKLGVRCCSVLQRVAVCCSVSCTQWAKPGVRCCNVLQLASCVSCTECARAWGTMLQWSV